jgi:hypothetical protein
VDKAGPVLISASASKPVDSSGNLEAGTVLTLTFSEDINVNSLPGSMSEADFKVEPEGSSITGNLDGATATSALGAGNNQLDVTLASATVGMRTIVLLRTEC